MLFAISTLDAEKLLCIAGYAWLCFLIFYPPQELIRSGLTLGSLFQFYLPDERRSFVNHHMRRIWCNVLFRVYAVLGLVILTIVLYHNALTGHGSATCAHLFVGFVFIFLMNVIDGRWDPLVKVLSLYDSDWRRVAAEINEEYADDNKYVARLAGDHRLVVTTSWVIFIESCVVKIMKQQDANLVVVNVKDRGARNRLISVHVQSSKEGIASFVLRLNNRQFNEMRQKLSVPVSVADGIKFLTSEEHFLKVFNAAIMCNPHYDPKEHVSETLCIGCFQEKVNVKLINNCRAEYSSGEAFRYMSRCTPCHCRPVWCLDCIGRWFMANQHDDKMEKWLEGDCPCPNCRATFCIKDIFLLSESH